MTDRFKGLSGITDVLKGIQNTETKFPSPIIPDKRSRTEVREDFEKELSLLDKSALIELKEAIISIHEHGESPETDLFSHKNDIENALTILIRHIDNFNDINSDESRKVSLKEAELKLEAKHDWSEKTRLFFFRVLASLLFILTLFTIGYIEHEYDWARLPMSKYIKTPLPMAK